MTAQILIERTLLFDVPVDLLTKDIAIAEIDRIIKSEHGRGYILAINPEKVNVLRRNPILLEMFEKATLLLPDGIGIVLAVRLLYKRMIERVTGADLMLNICGIAPQNGYKIFIYGAREEINAKACAILQQRNPGIEIVGRANGFIPESEMSQLIKKINTANPDILFVALGSPRQELWIRKYFNQLDVKICQGIGGTLDTIAGNVKRAPLIFQHYNMEWLYRLMREPQRWRRQIFLPKFALAVLFMKFRGRSMEKVRSR